MWRVTLWVIHIKLLVFLSVRKNDKRLNRIWIRSLRVIGILLSSGLSKKINLNFRLFGN